MPIPADSAVPTRASRTQESPFITVRRSNSLTESRRKWRRRLGDGNDKRERHSGGVKIRGTGQRTMPRPFGDPRVAREYRRGGYSYPLCGRDLSEIDESCVHDIPTLRRNFEVSRDMAPVHCSHGVKYPFVHPN